MLFYTVKLTTTTAAAYMLTNTLNIKLG